jgi:hypothetical protein
MSTLTTGVGFELKEKVAELSELILSKHPRMPLLLREIHTALRKQPENVTLMSEEEIAVVVAGLKVQTGVEFATAAIKDKSPSTTKRLKNATVDDF